ncbi:MAG: PIN domain-containing protein [Saccharofermentanales bacterium]
MKILIDTNVIIDVLINRDSFVDNSSAVLKLCESEKLQGFITATTITDIYYVLCKSITDKAVLYNALEKLLSIVEVCDVTKHNVFNALRLRESDFEDAIQSDCAESICADYIITRNIVDFKNSKIKAINPSDFLMII